jgi:hypothetical protein
MAAGARGGRRTCAAHIKRAATAWAWIGLGCLACSDSPVGSRGGDVTIAARALDQVGDPLPFLPIVVSTWHGTQQSAIGAGFLTDTNGILVLHDTLRSSLGPLDSVDVRTFGPAFCGPATLYETRVKATDTSWALTLRFEVSRPRVASGEFCSLAFTSSSESGSEVDVHIKIDSVTDSVRGVWQLVFVAPIATQSGSFTGAMAGGTLALDLMSPVGPPCVPHYRLVAAVSVDSVIGLARLEPIATCSPIAPFPFRFVPFDSPSFP